MERKVKLKTRIKTSLISLTLLVLVLAFTFTGCSKGKNDSEKEKSDYYIYCITKDYSQVVAEPYVMKASYREAQVQEIIIALAEYDSEKRSVLRPLPDGVSILDYTFGNNEELTINFSSEYQKLGGIDEILTRAAIVKTLCQVKGVEYIEFYIDGFPYLVNDIPVGLMKPDDFIDNTGEEIFFSQTTYLTVFFTDSTGTKLKASHRKVGYNGTISLERLIIEQLLSGPISDEIANGMYNTMPEGTVLNTITKNDETVIIDLSSQFLDGIEGVSKEVIVYSLVNSLCELTGVRKVRFVIDGKSVEFFGNVAFGEEFEMNLSLISED